MQSVVGYCVCACTLPATRRGLHMPSRVLPCTAPEVAGGWAGDTPANWGVVWRLGAPGAAAGPCLALLTWRDGVAASSTTKEQRDRRP